MIGQLRLEATASGKSFQGADLALDAAALDELWDGLDRVDTHFWEEESFLRYMDSGSEIPPAGAKRSWWKFWEAG